MIYCTLSNIVHTFFKKIDDEILPAYYTWKVVEKGAQDQVDNAVLRKISQLEY
jgi:hypothetical protein